MFSRLWTFSVLLVAMIACNSGIKNTPSVQPAATPKGTPTDLEAKYPGLKNSVVEIRNEKYSCHGEELIVVKNADGTSYYKHVKTDWTSDEVISVHKGAVEERSVQAQFQNKFCTSYEIGCVDDGPWKSRNSAQSSTSVYKITYPHPDRRMQEFDSTTTTTITASDFSDDQEELNQATTVKNSGTLVDRISGGKFYSISTTVDGVYTDFKQDRVTTRTKTGTGYIEQTSLIKPMSFATGTLDMKNDSTCNVIVIQQPTIQ